MIFHLPRVCLCNRTRCVPAFPLAHPVPLHVPSMGVPVGPPVIRVGIPPSFLRVPAVLAVIGIIGHFLPVPSPLALPLTVPSGAISLFLHPRTRNEQPATRHTTTTSCHEAPPDHDWAIGCLFPCPTRVGQFREHSNRWVSFSEHRWVNLGERQRTKKKTDKKIPPVTEALPSTDDSSCKPGQVSSRLLWAESKAVQHVVASYALLEVLARHG